MQRNIFYVCVCVCVCAIHIYVNRKFAGNN